MSIPITGHTRLYALLGSPVVHSVSPLIHNESFRYHGLDCVYLCFDVKEERLETAINGLRETGVCGFNLTMPCKNVMARLSDRLSPAAQICGAVNTVVCEDGLFSGHNTDGMGFVLSLKDAGYDITGKTMTVLGAGGAASSICAQTALDGVSCIHIFARPTSRFWKRTETLIQKINSLTSCRAYLHEQADSAALKAAIDESAILVNGSSVGMTPNTDASLIEDTSFFHPGLIVYDVIYEPRQTRLLRLAKESGCQTVNGLYMLLYQGAEAFRLWTGKEMPVELIKEKYFRLL